MKKKLQDEWMKTSTEARPRTDEPADERNLSSVHCSDPQLLRLLETPFKALLLVHSCGPMLPLGVKVLRPSCAQLGGSGSCVPSSLNQCPSFFQNPAASAASPCFGCRVF